MKLSPEKLNSIIRKNLCFTLFKWVVAVSATVLAFGLPFGVWAVFGLSCGDSGTLGTVLGLCVTGLIVFLLEMVSLDVEDASQSFFVGLFSVLYYKVFKE